MDYSIMTNTEASIMTIINIYNDNSGKIINRVWQSPRYTNNQKKQVSSKKDTYYICLRITIWKVLKHRKKSKVTTNNHKKSK